jgi:hypothetical protein
MGENQGTNARKKNAEERKIYCLFMFFLGYLALYVDELTATPGVNTIETRVGHSHTIVHHRFGSVRDNVNGNGNAAGDGWDYHDGGGRGEKGRRQAASSRRAGVTWRFT